MPIDGQLFNCQIINEASEYFLGRVQLTSLAARMMVVICDRSPHSARKVRVKAWMKIGEVRGPRHLSLRRSGGVVFRPCSRSCPA